jgi:predicted membrane-bound spermidine synthase
MTKIKETYDSLGQKLLPFLQGECIVLVILVQAIILASAFIFLPQMSLRKKGIERRGLFLKVFFFFGLIGMGFMFVEITLIQKFALFLGHPLFSFSIIIFALLFSSGIGSLFSKRILGKNVAAGLKRILLICSIFLISSPLSLSLLFKHGMGFPLAGRIALTFFCVFPLGFFMGFPFPAGIGMLEKKESRLIPWAWATNAFSSVINSVFALYVAFWGGYTLVLVLAGICYLLALPMILLDSAAKT